MQFLSDKVVASNFFDEQHQARTGLYNKENAELVLKNETLNLWVRYLQERMRNIEQYSRINNIEVIGILISPREDVKLIVKDLGAALEVEVQPRNILNTMVMFGRVEWIREG